MSNRFVITFNLFALFVVLMLVSIAHAEQWDKETVVTFSNPIEVPGRVLPAGTYIFKLASSQSDRRIVQIFTQDQRKVLATIQAIPDYRLEATDQTAISFEERPSGKPEALRNWFYPGDNYGVHFVYPKSAGNPADRSRSGPGGTGYAASNDRIHCANGLAIDVSSRTSSPCQRRTGAASSC